MWVKKPHYVGSNDNSTGMVNLNYVSNIYLQERRIKFFFPFWASNSIGNIVWSFHTEKAAMDAYSELVRQLEPIKLEDKI